MKIKSMLISATVCAVALSANSAEPLSWERTPNRPAPAQFDVFHGESLDFRCTFTGFGALPFAGASDVRLWYQTNGMGAAWWSIPATVSSNALAATFTPDRDPGAERLAVFFGAPSNAYAAAQVRFRNSPGAHPNDLEPPSVLDWQVELSSATNALAVSLSSQMSQSATNYTDEAVGELKRQLEVGEVYVSNADFAENSENSRIADIAYGLQNHSGYDERTADEIFAQLDAASRITTNDVCGIVTNEVPAFYSPWNFSPSAPEGFWYYLLFSEYLGETYWILLRLPLSVTPEEAAGFNDDNEGDWGMYAIDENSGATRLDTFVHFVQMGSGITASRTYVQAHNALGLARMKDIPTNHVTHAELKEAINSIPEVDTSNLATKAELTPIQSSVNSMWATLYGENVWIAITNHMRQVANTVPSLRLWEVRASQTNMVYSSAEEIEHVASQKVNEVKLEIKGMIPRTAWGSYQSSGEENPSSNAVTVVNSSKIMLTGGGEWYRTVETGGRAIWVLKTNGMMTLGGDTNGYFRVCDAEGNAQIEVVKTADLTVSAVPSATTFVDGDFTVTFNAGGSTHPTASCALDLGDDFETEDGSGNINSLGISISWAKNSDNLWVATVHQDNPSDKLFLYAKALLQGENLVRNNAPTALDGGIYINGAKYRIVPYSTGDKTYMTLEAWQ